MQYERRTGIKAVEKGDKIIVPGYCVTIEKILMQEYFPAYKNTPEYWNVEFLDPDGHYHHWKSEFDGGRILPKSENDK